MSRAVGVLAARTIRVGLVEGNRLFGPALEYPAQPDELWDLKTVPVE